MPKLPNVTDAEIIACYVAQNAALDEMQDFADRIQKGYVERIENPVSTAKNFAVIARAANDMAVRILLVAEMQQQRDELNAQRDALNALRALDARQRA